MSKSRGKARKTYNLKMFSPKDEQTFNQFRKVGIYNGHNTRDLLVMLMDKYISNNSARGPKLVTESEFLDEAKKKGLKTTKAILIKHRTAGNLNGMWWSSPDGRIVYDAVPVLKFFQKRQGRGSGGWLQRKKTNEKS